jgi:dTDP-4-amino-4,6-dideoxygalactose transaminase
MQKAYAGLGYTPEDFPMAARVAQEILSLPMFPQLAAAQLARVATQIRSFTAGSTLAVKKALEASFAATQADA